MGSEDIQPPPHVTMVRRASGDDPLAYRVALRLHANADLDVRYSHVDLPSLSRPEMRELLADIDSSTGIGSGNAYDAAPEEGD